MEKRLVNCDILRILAFIFVISVHFLSYIGFYNQINEGPTMIGLNILRCLFMSCVPLFLVLTGYLMCNKEFNAKYIKKLGRIVLTYFLCSIVCLVFLHFIENRSLSTLKFYLFEILSFNAAPYSWYVNMYIGLYLIIPFLNILWKNIPKKKQKQYFIFILSILFVLPTLFNIYNFQDINWWLNPASSKVYQQIIPNYWEGNSYRMLS